mgnify:CR=1 FL=1
MHQRKAYYISAEYLIGRMVYNNLFAMGVLDDAKALLAEKGVDLKQHPSVDLREYIYDMATVMRAADLVLSRAGASTISELTALGIPAILVPSPNVTNNHQEKNAQVLADAGGVVMGRESECSGKKLFELSAQILKDEVRQREMSNAMLTLGVPGAAELILETVLSLRK